jgi:hypothetical protein
VVHKTVYQKQLSLLGRAFLLALPLLLFTNLILWSGYELSVENLRERWRSLSESLVDSTLHALEERYSDLRADLYMLATNPDITRVVTDYDETILSRIASEWELFVTEKRLYDQIRIIDLQGMERLRIDQVPYGASRVPASLLQDKSQRYYFQQGLLLKSGGIYVSPIDLNLERGKVELPYKPMIRLVFPLEDSEGEIKSLLVLNALASHILDDLERQAHLVEGDMLLLDKSGYYLRGFSRDQEWGFMFPEILRQSQRFDLTYPEVWDVMQQSITGQITNKDGIFSYRNVNFGSNGNEQTYRLVIALSQEQMHLLLTPKRTLWQGMALTLSLLLLLSVMIFSRYQLGKSDKNH